MRSTARDGRAAATGPGDRMRSLVLGVVSAAIVLLALAGYAAPSPTAASCSASAGLLSAPTAASCATATPRTASPTATASPTSTAGSLPGGSALLPLEGDSSDVGPTSVITAKESDADAPSINVTTAAISGTDVVRMNDTIAPPTEGTVSDWVMGTQHDPVAAVFGALARTVHTDASGLDPESWTTTVQAFTPGSGLTGDPIALRQCSTESCKLHESSRFGSVVILDYQPDDAAEVSNRVLAIDLDTGKSTWSRDNAKLVTFSPTAAILERSDGEGNGGAEHPVVAVDPATGHVDWTFADRDHNPAQEIEPVLSEQYAVITSDDENDAKSRSNLVDLTDGHVIAVRYGDGSWALDPATGRVVVSGTAGTAYGESDLTVLSTTGSIIYGISHDRFDALGSPSVIGAVDGRAWIPSGSTADAFDTATGVQDPDSPLLTGSTDQLYPRQYDGSAILVGQQSSDSALAVLLDPARIPSYTNFIALRSTSG